ncbi:MAG: rhodanese-like domain-containing protein [Pyrinomonadaceae bacterium]
MQFILSLAITLIFSLAMFQCGKTKVGDTNQAINTTAVAANSAVQIATPDDGAPRITLADAKADYDAGRAIIVDARPADSYKVEHIKGAINIPLGDFEAEYKNIPTNKKIIVYCS